MAIETGTKASFGNVIYPDPLCGFGKRDEINALGNTFLLTIKSMTFKLATINIPTKWSG